MRHFKIRQGNLFETTKEGKRINDKFINPNDNEFASIVTKLADEDNKEFNEIPEMDVWGGLEYDRRGNVVGGYPEEINKIYHADELMNVHQLDADEVTSSKTRMAGDLLSDMRIESLLQEAKEFLPQRRQELNQMFPQSEFKSMSPLQQALQGEKNLDSLNRLQGNVPQPIMRKDGERGLTKYAIDETTGQELIVPVLDPNDTSKALSVQFGARPADIGRGEIKQADEIVSEAALKMMGYKVDMPSSSKLADFQATDSDGNLMKIDGMQIETGLPIDMQTHSYVGMFHPTRRQTLSVNELQDYLLKETAAGRNLIDIIDEAADGRRTIGPPDARDLSKRAGKLMRGDRTSYRVDEDQEYDALIMPEYKHNVRFQRDWNKQPNKVITAPSGFWMADMPGAFDAVRAGQSGPPQVVHNRMKPGKHKINVAMDRDTKVDGQRVFIDLLKNNPQLAQLLDEKTMKKRVV